MRQVIIYTDENGEWCASCPSLPGCHSQGETREATIANIRDAIEAYIEALEVDGLPVPPEVEHREIVTLDVA
ncbi:MAG: type II toxin-antitoxin system HicB family antitoxin [Anaerolineae bacterium]|nr:type II toxin-antitoxin system HicB family antitoxin [Anaerolineae bacterium]